MGRGAVRATNESCDVSRKRADIRLMSHAKMFDLMSVWIPRGGLLLMACVVLRTHAIADSIYSAVRFDLPKFLFV